MIRILEKAAKSPQLLSAAVFGAGGVAFAVANLLLADIQTVEEYAVFALLIATLMLFSGLGIFGADGIVNRHQFVPDGRMLRRVAATGLASGAVAAGILSAYYAIDVPLVLVLFAATVVQSLVYFAAAYHQSRQEFWQSTLIMNSFNYVLLAAALIAHTNAWQDAFTPFLLAIAFQAMVALACTANILSRKSADLSGYIYNWREALAYISITGSAVLLTQLERLITPKLLDMQDLATLGVLLAMVGPPFRLLQITLGYVLLPKLRMAAGVAEMRALIWREIQLALALLVPSCVAVWYLVPVLDTYLFGNKYPVTGNLIAAVIVAGNAKALSGIARASVAALVSDRQLEVMGLVGWASVGVSILAAMFGAQWGLAGIVYGVSLGWLLRLVVSVILVRNTLTGAHEGVSARGRALVQADRNPS